MKKANLQIEIYKEDENFYVFIGEEDGSGCVYKIKNIDEAIFHAIKYLKNFD